ncbi:LOCUS ORCHESTRATING VICTORIN EFFECTS1 [Hibiscus trionum]|uniref:LOCUS ORCHESTRATING VICTORIN EFFECTS1 n=1 Tax=Hibiscus trionum TaxID=183268 RepID=A0A9W7LPU3_HIBTR|nr:LOCUS ORCHESTRATING VICTORIN EFFECTS1 [Hibiscus trionum]
MDERMEILGKEMVKHCGGLPLAIVVLGGILKHKETCVEWETIHQCIKSYLKGEVIFRLLALSYDDLPYELKPCFLYLAMFPEDFEISRDRLINLWVAEGIIHPPRVERQGEEALEDIGYRYLTELAERYMIVVAKRDAIGRIKRCQMHDLMREFCLSKSQEENFSHVVPLYGTQTQSLNISSSSSSSSGRIRRLSLHLNRFPGNVALECEKYPPFKSLLGFSLDQLSGLSQRLTATLVHSFKLLRIMDLQSVKHFIVPKKTSKLISANRKFTFKSRTTRHTPGMVRLGRVRPAAPPTLSTTMPKTIGKLIHLRLLSFGTGYNIPKLPSSIGNLSCLLTLRIDFHYAQTLPNVFWKLKRLRHLYLPRWVGQKTRLEFAGLTDLRTLVNFPTYCADVQDLITLTNLRRLKIEASGDVSLQKLQMMFMSPSITFDNLRDFSISDSLRTPQHPVIDDNIKSCCPRLLLLKSNGNVVYQKTVDVFRLEEEQLA